MPGRQQREGALARAHGQEVRQVVDLVQKVGVCQRDALQQVQTNADGQGAWQRAAGRQAAGSPGRLLMQQQAGRRRQAAALHSPPSLNPGSSSRLHALGLPVVPEV